MRKRKEFKKANQKHRQESKESATEKDIDTGIGANDKTQGEADQIDCSVQLKKTFKNLKTDDKNQIQII